MSEEKVCIKCGETKPIELFERYKGRKVEVGGRCKSCKTAATSREYRAYYRMIEKQNKFPIPIETDYEEVKQIFDMFEDRCAYCLVVESAETGTIQLEHIKAMDRGGRHHVSNLVIACKSCNSKKQNRPLIEFYRMHPPFTGAMLDFIFMYVARFSGRDPEEVAKEFYAEVAEVPDGKTTSRK